MDANSSKLTRDDRDHRYRGHKHRSCRDDKHRDERHRDSSNHHHRHRSRRERTYDDKREKEGSSERERPNHHQNKTRRLQIVIAEVLFVMIMSTHAHEPPPSPNVAPLEGSLRAPRLSSGPNPVTQLPGGPASPHPVPQLESHIPASTTSQRAFVEHNVAPPPAPKPQRARGFAGHAVAPPAAVP